MIIKKIEIDKKDLYTVAKETNHSMLAVDRYIKDFNGVRLLTKMVKTKSLYPLQPD